MNLLPAGSFQSTRTQQMLRIMQLTAILVFIGCLSVSAKGVSQITINETNAPLQTVFEQIHLQSGYDIIYNGEVIRDAGNVTVRIKNFSLQQALEVCLSGKHLTYQIKEKTVVIKEKRSSNISNLPPLFTVKGKVVDENGEPVFANIVIKGTNIGTITDDHGYFTLKDVNENSILVITAANIETREITVTSKDNTAIINVKMRISHLQDVQFIAYGSTTKRAQTGNVTTVRKEDLQKQPVNNPLLALEGRVPGMFVTQDRGFPGGSVTVRIQGQNSLASGNEPLYVIDGVPYTGQLLSTGLNGTTLGTAGSINSGVSAGNPLNYINIADIESIEVLKDADATAIYGSRAGNGAVLITMKKGKEGVSKVEFNLQHGWGKVSRKLSLLNTSQYIQMRREAISNDGLSPDPFFDFDLTLWDSSRNTDWQKVLIGGTAHYTDAEASVSDGTSRFYYLVGVGYHNETTVYPADFSDKRRSIHLNLGSNSVNKKFHFQLSGNYVLDENQLPFNNDFTAQAIKLPPNAPSIYNQDGTLNWEPSEFGVSSWANPFASLYNRYKNNTSNLIGNLNVGYELLPGLQIKSNFGITNLQSREIGINTLYARAPETRPTSNRGATYGDNNISSWIIEPQVEYDRTFGKSKIDFLLGSTFQENSSRGQSITGIGFNSDEVLEDIKSAAAFRVNSSVISKYKYNAVFARMNYVLTNRYFINLSARRDGSSRFGTNNSLHNFGAVGAAWIFSEERLFKGVQALNYGKLRVSYGTTGNDQIGDYKFLTLYAPPNSAGVPYQGITGLSVTGLPNFDLQWEETRKFNIGLDIGLIKNRVLLTTNYAINRSSHQLVIYSLPINTGFHNILKNLDATIENTSIECAINSVNVRTKNVFWTTNVNFTVPKNRLARFPGLENTGYNNSLVIGQPVNVIKAFKYEGVDVNTGLYQFETKAGELSSLPDFLSDQTVFIKPDPEWYGGIQNTISYKGLQIDFLFQYVKQVGPSYVFGDFMPGLPMLNQPTSVLGRWQHTSDAATIQKYNSDYTATEPFFDAIFSDGTYRDASYIRLKNVSVSWEIFESVTRKLKMKNCSIYVHGQNLWTKTNYVGLDPETKSSAVLPPLRTITFGIRAGF